MVLDSFPSAAVTAVEISFNAIMRARDLLQDYPGRVELINADIIEHEALIKEGSFDVCIWSESVYYVGARSSLNETYRLLERVVGKLVPGGMLVMANTVDLPEKIPEFSITRRPLIDCYHRMLSSLAKPAQKAIYFDEKLGWIYEYQIWAFFRPPSESAHDAASTGVLAR